MNWLARFTQPKQLGCFVASFVVSYALGYATFSSLLDRPVPTVVNTEAPVVEVLPNVTEPLVEASTAPVVVLNDAGMSKVVVEVKKPLRHYTELPKPKADGAYSYYGELFERVSEETGVSVRLLARVASVESSFQRKAQIKNKSTSAKGLFQFIDTTWEAVVAKHGAQYGIDHTTSVFDPRANALLGALHIKDNQALLKRVVGDRQINEVDIYLTHFLGRTGALRFLKADPQAIAANNHRGPAKRNKPVFFGKDKKARTYEEVYQALHVKFEVKAKEFNLTQL